MEETKEAKPKKAKAPGTKNKNLKTEDQFFKDVVMFLDITTNGQNVNDDFAA